MNWRVGGLEGLENQRTGGLEGRRTGGMESWRARSKEKRRGYEWLENCRASTGELEGWKNADMEM